MSTVYAVIGDLVSSRLATSRVALQRSLEAALVDTSATLPHVQPLAPTVGDEFQGVFGDLGGALTATLQVRLQMLPVCDVRFGIGRGEVVDVGSTTGHGRIQDGSAWWNARDALTSVSGRRSARTWYESGDASDSERRDLVNAYLVCRDKLVDRLGKRAREMSRLALQGHTQSEIASLLGVTQGAVSQQFTRGIAALRESQKLVQGLGEWRP